MTDDQEFDLPQELKDHIECGSESIIPGLNILLMKDGTMGVIFQVPNTQQMFVLGGTTDFKEAATNMTNFLAHIMESHIGTAIHERKLEPDEVMPVAVSGNRTVH